MVISPRVESPKKSYEPRGDIARMFGEDRREKTDGNNRSQAGKVLRCWKCDAVHARDARCRAEGEECWKCKKKGHFARCCKGARVSTMKERAADDSEDDSSTINMVRRDGVYDDRDILTIDQRPLSLV